MNDVPQTINIGNPGVQNTGNAPIYINPDRLPRKPRDHPEDDFLWLSRHFVAPRGLGAARGVLERHRTVLLDGPPGSGRVTAAKMLLWGLRHGRPRELTPEAAEEHPESIQADDRVWLNLSDADDELWRKNYAELAPLRNSISEHGAYLVVVLPQNADLEPVHLDYRAWINPPDTRVLLRRYLSIEGIPHPQPFPDLRFLRTPRSPWEIATHVKSIREIRKQAADKGDLESWSDAAGRPDSAREGAVPGRVAALDPAGRAFMLAVAMLHGTHSDVVHEVAAWFWKRVDGTPSDPEPGIMTEQPLDIRLKEIGAGLGPAEEVRFTDPEPNYDALVREYFWIHMPGLRPGIREWVASAVASPSIPEKNRSDLATRFTELCLHERYRAEWTALVEQLTVSWNWHSRTAAADVLGRGLADEKYGRAFRRQIYAWATDDGIPAPRIGVIIAACRDVMIHTYWDEAVVRLHHLARRRPRGEASALLVPLARQDRRILRLLLTRIALTGPKRFREADATLFLELADPELLAPGADGATPTPDRDDIRSHLISGWRLAFGNLGYDQWRYCAKTWLRHAARDDRDGDALLTILVHASGARATILNRLYALSQEPELQDPVGEPLFIYISKVLANGNGINSNNNGKGAP